MSRRKNPPGLRDVPAPKLAWKDDGRGGRIAYVGGVKLHAEARQSQRRGGRTYRGWVGDFIEVKWANCLDMACHRLARASARITNDHES